MTISHTVVSTEQRITAREPLLASEKVFTRERGAGTSPERFAGRS